MDEREEKPKMKRTANSADKSKLRRVEDNQDRPRKSKNLADTKTPTKKRRPRTKEYESEGRSRLEPKHATKKKVRPEGEGVRRSSPSKLEEAVQKSSRPRQEGARRSRSEHDMRRHQAGMNQTQGKSSKKRKKKNPIKKFFLIFLLLIIIAAGAVAALYWIRYGPGQEKADLNEYYGIETQEQVAIILDDEVIEAKGRIIEGVIYVDYPTLRDYINSRFYLDISENVLLYTLPNEVLRIEPGSREYNTMEGVQSEDYTILQTLGSDTYIALEFVQNYTNIDFETFEEPNRVSIITQWGEITVAEVKSDTQVRRLAGIKSPILTELAKAEQVVVLEDEGDWRKVRTDNAFIGYVKKDALQAETIQNRVREFVEPVYTNISRDHTINLGWHQVTSQIANQSISEVLARSPGMNVISPTWFSVADNDGNMHSLVNTDYVVAAQQAGVEVWALVDNFGSEVNSHELLINARSRENMANQLVDAVLAAGIEGINLDFESLREETGEHYVQFIRELSVKCRANGIVLSVDNYVPRIYTAFYNRKEQGVVADYVIIMGYDEHYSGSLEAGPVASIAYVEEGILATIADVPPEKVINGVPFYTRIWSEVPKTEAELASEVGTAEGEYRTKVSSKAVGMVEALNIVQEAGAVPQWDDVAKLDYATWEEDGITYKVWLENVASLEPRLQLMQQHGLAGTAAWKIGFETPDIWELISQYVN